MGAIVCIQHAYGTASWLWRWSDHEVPVQKRTQSSTCYWNICHSFLHCRYSPMPPSIFRRSIDGIHQCSHQYSVGPITAMAAEDCKIVIGHWVIFRENKNPFYPLPKYISNVRKSSYLIYMTFISCLSKRHSLRLWTFILYFFVLKDSNEITFYEKEFVKEPGKKLSYWHGAVTMNCKGAMCITGLALDGKI